MIVRGRSFGQHLVGKFVLAHEINKGRVAAFTENVNGFPGGMFTVEFTEPNQTILYFSSDDMVGWSFCDTSEQRDAIFAQLEWTREAFSVA
jgi:hypothetical protein